MLLSAAVRPRLLALAALAATACGGSTQNAPKPSPPTPVPTAEPRPVASAAQVAEPPAGPGTPCGALECRAFDDPVQAFDAVLATDQPQALGIGEAHAQKGTEQIASSTKRFTEQLLPELKGKASDLIVELLLPDGSCKKTAQKVAKQQKPVTEPQAKENQNEFLVLGKAARKLGVIPDVLRPSCEELTRITEAGAGDIGVMLETIARLTRTKVESLLAQNAKDDKSAMVVAYGGALHNDLAPRKGREAWSYGPALAQITNGHYTELDVIVPEYIKDTETWTSLPWVKHYDRKKLGSKTVLFHVAPRSWVLVFPTTPSESKAASVQP